MIFRGRFCPSSPVTMITEITIFFAQAFPTKQNNVLFRKDIVLSNRKESLTTLMCDSNAN